MSEPRGNLVLPVAENPSDELRGLELDANDNLMVSVQSTVEHEVDNNIFDGTNWQKQKGDTSGNTYAILLPHGIYGLSGVSAIAKRAVATNATTTIHTVTAGKTFYLTSIWVVALNTAAAASGPVLKITTAAPADIMIWDLQLNGIGHGELSLPFNPPIPVSAGNLIVVLSAAPAVTVVGSITGYEL